MATILQTPLLLSGFTPEEVPVLHSSAPGHSAPVVLVHRPLDSLSDAPYQQLVSRLARAGYHVVSVRSDRAEQLLQLARALGSGEALPTAAGKIGLVLTWDRHLQADPTALAQAAFAACVLWCEIRAPEDFLLSRDANLPCLLQSMPRRNHLATASREISRLERELVDQTANFLLTQLG